VTIGSKSHLLTTAKIIETNELFKVKLLC